MAEAFTRVKLFQGGLGAHVANDVLVDKYQLPRLESFERMRDLFSVREHRYENVRLNNSAVRTKAVFAIIDEVEQ